MSAWNPEQENTRLESISAFGVTLRAGDRVRIWPQKSADIFDMALKGKVAIIEAIESDFDNQVHLAVVLEDDPGRDFGMLRQPGHRFFFSPEEVEPMALDREVPGEDLLLLRMAFVPGVADAQGQVVGQVGDVRAAGIRLGPVRRIGDEVVDRLRGVGERGFRTGGDDAHLQNVP